MKIIQHLRNQVQIVQIVGDLDLYSSYRLKESLESLMVTPSAVPVRKIVIDLGRVDHIDSSGLGALIQVYSLARKQKFPIAFINVSGSVGNVIETARLSTYFPIAETMKDALRISVQ